MKSKLIWILTLVFAFVLSPYIQIISQPCKNPGIKVSGQSAFTDTICSGTYYSIKFFTNGADTIQLNWNGGIAGASFNTTGSSAQQEANFSWKPPIGLTFTDSFNVQAVSLKPPFYNPCDSTKKTFVIHVDTATFYSKTSITGVNCKTGKRGEISIDTIVGGTADDIEWSGPNNFSDTSRNIADLQAGTYRVTITDTSKTCPLVQEIKVPLVKPLQSNASFSDYNGYEVSCPNAQDGRISLDMSSGKEPYTFDWDSSQTTDSVITGLDAGTHEVTVTDKKGCTLLDSFTLKSPKPLSLETEGDSLICHEANNGKVKVLDVNGGVPYQNGNAPYQYLWEDSTETPENTNLSRGTYQVTVTDKNGCKDTTSVEIVAAPLAEVEIGAKTELFFGETTELTGQPQSGLQEPVQYLWQHTDQLADSAGQKVNGTFTESDSIALQAEGANGCEAMDTLFMDVAETPKKLFVPNAFTPNGDGVNDKLEVYIPGVKEFRMEIFNRWGELITRLNKENDAWDGTNNGNPVKSGVYAYILWIEYQDNNTKKRVKGSITLMR